jgi:hypothetical protein
MPLLTTLDNSYTATKALPFWDYLIISNSNLAMGVILGPRKYAIDLICYLIEVVVLKSGG